MNESLIKFESSLEIEVSPLNFSYDGIDSVHRWICPPALINVLQRNGIEHNGGHHSEEQINICCSHDMVFTSQGKLF